MADSGAQVSGFVLCHMRIADMRPREDFERFDQVQVIGTGITGRIERIDADRRLAWLITPNKDGWWYLKDLEKTYFISRRAAEKSFLTTNDTTPLAKNARVRRDREDTKKVQFTCDPDRFYAKFNRYPCVLIPYEDVVDA
jgi:hypothetical protein